MPVKNAGHYLKPCLDSIIGQSYRNWELIAINDGSTDGSKEMLVSYSDRYDNILTCDNDGEGIISALQMAYSLSKGEWIHRMDADDIMPAYKLNTLKNLAQKGSVVTGKVHYFCDEQQIGEGFVKYANWLNALMEGGDFWRDIYRECPIPSSAWLLHRLDFDSIGAFNSSLLPEDYDLCFRIFQNNLKVLKCKDVVHQWRDSSTRTSRNADEYFPLAYLPLKVHYFLKLHRAGSRPLVLWGAGKKGKLVAKLLLEKKIIFDWITDNAKKSGKDIYGIVLKDACNLSSYSQVIIAVSSPDEQMIIQHKLNQESKINNLDYFWFF